VAVVVACKVPNGLRITADGREALIAGPQRPVPGQPVPIQPGGYALTEGVDTELWTAWVEANAAADVVTKKMIFAADTLDQARGLAYVNGRASSIGHGLGAERRG
jgi:hypothetical protein